MCMYSGVGWGNSSHYMYMYSGMSWCNSSYSMYMYSGMSWCNSSYSMYMYSGMRWCNSSYYMCMYSGMRWCLLILLHVYVFRDELEEYMELLVRNFNLQTMDHLMCRDSVEVDWRGNLYDCDFNMQLNLPVPKGLPSLRTKFPVKKNTQKLHHAVEHV